MPDMEKVQADAKMAEGNPDSPAVKSGEAKAAIPNDTTQDFGEAAIRLGEQKANEPN